jgi:hypothetical protein
VPAQNIDPGVHGFDDIDLLLCRVVVIGYDDVGLERDRLAESRRTVGDDAGSIEDR